MISTRRALIGVTAALQLVTGCAATLPVRVLPRGQSEWTASVGGPLIPHHVPTGIVPYVVVGRMWGRSDDVTMSADLHLLPAAFGVAGVDVGLARRLVAARGARPEITGQAQLYAFAGTGGARLYPNLTGTASWEVTPGTLLYGGTAVTFQFTGPSAAIASPLTGVQRDLGRRCVLQLEGKWMAANVDMHSGLLEGENSVSGHGGLSLQLGVQVPSGTNAARMAMTVVVLVAGNACKLDTLVFNGDAVAVYRLPATVIPDSLLREVSFPSGNETLYGFWLRQGGSAPRLTVVFSHGKGENLADEAKWAHAEHLWQSGFDVLTYDYRGFGRSTGTSKDETTLIADASAALTFALAQPGVTLGRVVSFGHSMGSDPAIALAAANSGIRALVVESGFSNGQAMAQCADPLGFPVSWLMQEPMVNTTRIATVQAPVLILHGTDDVQIPVAQGRALYEAAHDPKELVIVPGAGHEDVEQVMGLAAFRTLMQQFTNAIAP